MIIMEIKMTLENTLKERGDRYGEFKNYALVAGTLNRVIECRIIDCENEKIEFIHTEALKMIISKIARIISGDPNYIENFRDIAGYATLVVNILEETEGATDARVIKIRNVSGKWVEE